MLARDTRPGHRARYNRAWVVGECPVAPGRRQAPGPGSACSPRPAGVSEKVTKTARFLILVTERHGSLASIPLKHPDGQWR